MPRVPPEAKKQVPANQKAIDSLPLGSGTWSVAGVPGLYVRCRAKTRTYFVQRRVGRYLIKESLGQQTIKAAKLKAMAVWSGLKPKPGAECRGTLAEAFSAFLDGKTHAPKTRSLHEYNFVRYLDTWKNRGIADIGANRPAVRQLQQTISRKYGLATANQVMRLLSAVYNWHRRIDPALPETPTVAIDLHSIPPRNWALDEAQLRAWWDTVKTLHPIKRTWWITALLTGARRGSIEALRWADVDLEAKTMLFTVTKRSRPYMVPISDILTDLLSHYQGRDDIPPSEWIFPSLRGAAHLTTVRDDKRGVPSPHHLRHTFRTVLAELGATTDQSRLLMGHSMGGDVSTGYISEASHLLIESLRPITNAVSARYEEILGSLIKPLR